MQDQDVLPGPSSSTRVEIEMSENDVSELAYSQSQENTLKKRLALNQQVILITIYILSLFISSNLYILIQVFNLSQRRDKKKLV